MLQSKLDFKDAQYAKRHLETTTMTERGEISKGVNAGAIIVIVMRVSAIIVVMTASKHIHLRKLLSPLKRKISHKQ